MNTKQFGIGALTGVMALAVMAPAAYGAEGERGGKGKGQRAQISEEVREELKATFENNDYDAYVEVTEDNDLSRVMTEEQFDARVAKQEQKAETKEAVLDGDYAAWRVLIGDEKATEVTEDNFDLLTDLAEAREAEDEEAIEAAREAMTDAGIEGKKKGQKGKGSKEGRGDKEGQQGLGKALSTENISELSSDEKQDLFESIMEQIRVRLGLA